MRVFGIGALVLLASCDPDAETRDTGTEEGPLELLFSFGVIADPHVSGEGEHADRLVQTVDWFNENASERGIELVLVLGDIGWNEGLELSRELLDELDMPYAPIIGDNEVHAYQEAEFAEVFAAPLAALEAVSEGWSQDNDLAWNPDYDQDSTFGNFGFDYKGVRFLSLDWASRSDDSLLGEMGDLHDFEGGTWPWFESQITDLATDRREDCVVMASHIPMAMIVGGFDAVSADAINALTSAYADLVWANFGGHWHIDVDTEIEEGGYEMYVTDAVWDDTITVRMVEVWGNETRFVYEQELVTVE